ncbi:hypothetical protein [Burkholderia lata]|uniref:hypothetical protein n=1 Tax=Burkholderia lata (strain ATCC 17760 / DSM 23089 / LMG 22485 / NCIMB 9086 / R18194 / 383) TaxID=482957 RepID=UPI001582D5AB|nr:hypothetical protein [Burkholderia lata]
MARSCRHPHRRDPVAGQERTIRVLRDHAPSFGDPRSTPPAQLQTRICMPLK